MADPAAPPAVTLRPATEADVPAMLGLMDTAIAWLVSQGRTGQWGDGKEASISNPARVAQFTDLARPNSPIGSSWVATTDAGSIIGALSVGAAPDYVRPAAGPELYVRLLITDRAWKGLGLGAFLVARARALGRAARVPVLRVDCYAGGDGKLVRWYESVGFERAETFEAKGGTWPGQVLVMRLGEDGLGQS